jgi:hypothetical protein
MVSPEPWMVSPEPRRKRPVVVAFSRKCSVSILRTVDTVCLRLVDMRMPRKLSGA